MQHVTRKIIGAAVLGAGFAAAGAGVASADVGRSAEGIAPALDGGQYAADVAKNEALKATKDTAKEGNKVKPALLGGLPTNTLPVNGVAPIDGLSKL